MLATALATCLLAASFGVAGTLDIAPPSTSAGVRLDGDGVLVASDSLLAVLRTLLESARPGRPLRVAQIGDSHTEIGRLGEEMATLMSRGGAVSPAFVTPFSRGLGRVKITPSKGWRRSTWMRPVAGGVDGPSGSAAITGVRTASMQLELRDTIPTDSRLTIWWNAPAGASFRVRVGGGAPRLIMRRAGDDAPMATESLVLPAGTREVTVDGVSVRRGETLRIDGFTIDRPDAAVAYDLLGLGGSTQRHPLRRQNGALEQFLRARQHDVILVWYGTNSVYDVAKGADGFTREYGALVDLVRAAAPGAAIVLIGPPDLAAPKAGCAGKPVRRKGKGKVRSTRRRRPPPLACAADSTATLIAPPLGAPCRPASRPEVAVIRDAELSVAASRAAAFFDAFRLQGEVGGMVRWFCARPSLASSDLIHLSADGYRAVGRALYEQLSEGRSPSVGRE